MEKSEKIKSKIKIELKHIYFHWDCWLNCDKEFVEIFSPKLNEVVLETKNMYITYNDNRTLSNQFYKFRRLYENDKNILLSEVWSKAKKFISKELTKINKENGFEKQSGVKWSDHD